jgi:hypothetical protein
MDHSQPSDSEESKSLEWLNENIVPNEQDGVVNPTLRNYRIPTRTFVPPTRRCNRSDGRQTSGRMRYQLTSACFGEVVHLRLGQRDGSLHSTR